MIIFQNDQENMYEAIDDFCIDLADSDDKIIEYFDATVVLFGNDFSSFPLWFRLFPTYEYCERNLLLFIFIMRVTVA